jgi:HD-like signal output (HDOD) protein
MSDYTEFVCAAVLKDTGQTVDEKVTLAELERIGEATGIDPRDWLLL